MINSVETRLPYLNNELVDFSQKFQIVLKLIKKADWKKNIN